MRINHRMSLALAAALSTATAAAQSVATVLQAQQHRVESVDARASGRLVMVDAAGKRTSYKFTLKMQGFPDGVRLLEEVDTPQPVRLLVRLEPTGRVIAHVAHKDAAGKWQAQAAPAQLSEPLAGTGFVLEDLVDDQFFWKDQSLVGRAACGSRQCVTLQSQPGSSDHTQYSKVVSSADEKTNALIHVVKTVRGSGVVKDIAYSALRESHGVSSATQMELKMAGRPGSTLVIVDRGTAKANLTLRDFDLGSSTLEDPNQQNQVD